MNIRLADIRVATDASCDLRERGTLIPSAVQTDSRKCAPGEIFFCLKGEHFDGHAYAAQAIAKGAVAVVAEHDLPEAGDTPVLRVDDCIKALGRLAAWHRARTRALVTGVTGTAGKTTVKELLASILGKAGVVAKNFLNLNNQIGLPLSMLAASGEEDFWVFELGISRPGDMDELGATLTPDIALIINAGAAHLEGLGDVRGVSENKARLLAHLAAKGLAVVNLDYPELAEAARRLAPDLIGFSCQGRSGRFEGRYLGPESGGRGRFQVQLAGRSLEFTLPRRGAFVAENCIAAATTACLAGVDVARLQAGLEGFQDVPLRFQCRNTLHFLVIDDAYNANPLSMAQALISARDMAEGRPLLLVLGEMRELGTSAGAAHRELGRQMATVGPVAVFWRGGFAEQVSEGLAEAGYSGTWSIIGDVAGFLSELTAFEEEGGVIVFKGSRSTRMDELSAALIGSTSNAV